MLFDLRGRHRRRIVRVVYGGLAVLFGSGLVLFGVGGFGGTGILTSLTGEESSGHSSFAGAIAAARKKTKKEPSNPSGWESLAKNLLHEASGEAYVSSTTGAATSKGKELYRQASEAWAGYLALNPHKPSLELAKLMVLDVYGVGGLDEASKAVEALQIVIADEPNSATWYSQLAEYSYKAHNTRQGDLASEKAVALAPVADRTRVKKELAEVKANPSGERTFTTTTNGKTYTGKLNSKGEIKATEAHTAPSSSKSTSTASKTTTSTTTK
jgi:hypothetical protein